MRSPRSSRQSPGAVSVSNNEPTRLAKRENATFPHRDNTAPSTESTPRPTIPQIQSATTTIATGLKTVPAEVASHDVFPRHRKETQATGGDAQ